MTKDLEGWVEMSLSRDFQDGEKKKTRQMPLEPKLKEQTT